MITILGERGAFLIAKHFQPSGYAGGLSVSEDLNISPARVAVHTGLARFGGTSRDYPGTATIGVSGFSFLTDDLQHSQTVDFGIEEQWETALYHDRVNAVTVSAFVLRGEMKGWWFLQVWG